MSVSVRCVSLCLSLCCVIQLRTHLDALAAFRLLETNFTDKPNYCGAVFAPVCAVCLFVCEYNWRAANTTRFTSAPFFIARLYLFAYSLLFLQAAGLRLSYLTPVELSQALEFDIF